MEPRENPFAPGAGCLPPALVGRDKILDETDVMLTRVMNGLPAKSMLMHGLRGVGKTVLLLRMGAIAKERGYQVISYESIEGVSPLAFLLHLCFGACCRIWAPRQRCSTPCGCLPALSRP